MSNCPDILSRNIEKLFFKSKIVEAMREFDRESENEFSYEDMIVMLQEVIKEVCAH